MLSLLLKGQIIEGYRHRGRDVFLNKGVGWERINIFVHKSKHYILQDEFQTIFKINSGSKWK